jgi:hypothetical protein
MAKAADVKTAIVMNAHGLLPRNVIRRRVHAKRALAAAATKAKEREKA